MLKNFIISQIQAQLPFEPNEEKGALLDVLGEFLVSHESRKCFVLKGYAGTGKTSVISALVRALEHLQQPTVLLAPTGRAAKVLARYSGFPAFTIHKWIYRQDSSLKETFSLADNKFVRTLFIVDEASMIAASRDNDTFGTGSLLDDLVHYVYSGEGCSLLLLGDDAQLPPVGSEDSKALDASFMQGYELRTWSFCLTQVARQALDSGILRNATALRQQLDEPNDFTVTPAQDIYSIEGSEVQELLEHAYQQVGLEETLIVTRSNKRTNLYNQGIRARLLWREDILSSGDRLMISKNNYFWAKGYDNLPFMANGDIVEVVRLRHEREMYGYRFVNASVRFIDYDWEVDTLLWLDTLLTDTPEASYRMQRTLYDRIAEDYPEVRNRRDLHKLIQENEYFNALQVRYAYAVTCHKAQGGQWKRVFIDRGWTPPDKVKTAAERREDKRWLYTALTRATEQVYML